jgi:hypothetical protein
MLSAITSECAVVSASLTRLQNLLLDQPERYGALAESLETSLLGCALTMSVLKGEIGGLADETRDGVLKVKKFKYVLEQDHLRELLAQIRGQQISITLLLATYQSESMSDVKQSIQDYNIILQQMANKGISLWRGSHAVGQQRSPPTTIIGLNEADSVFEMSSIITDTRFDFDSEVMNSKAYQKAMVYLRQAGYSEAVMPTALANVIDEHEVEDEKLDSTLLEADYKPSQVPDDITEEPVLESGKDKPTVNVADHYVRPEDDGVANRNHDFTAGNAMTAATEQDRPAVQQAPESSRDWFGNALWNTEQRLKPLSIASPLPTLTVDAPTDHSVTINDVDAQSEGITTNTKSQELGSTAAEQCKSSATPCRMLLT